MAASGAGLVASSPMGPVQDRGDLARLVPDQAGEEAADLGNGERDQLVDRTGIPLLAPAWAVVMVRKAWASMARVMWRYQLS